MLSNYLPILIFLVIATGLAVLLLVLGSGLGRLSVKSKNDPAKLSPYECGFEAFEDSRMFDLEIAFLFPWAVALGKLGLFGLGSMAIFLGILVVGFIYEWKKGALEWD